jgi:hypothetical protein
MSVQAVQSYEQLKAKCRALHCYDKQGRKRAERTDVWVVDLGEEPDFWGPHRVLFGEKELELEVSTWSEKGGSREGKARSAGRSNEGEMGAAASFPAGHLQPNHMLT